MRTAKGIMCMTCKIEHQPGCGYHFSEDLSIICDKCGKTLFATTQATEDKMTKISGDRKSRCGNTATVGRSSYGSSCYDYD